jgi:hypothetical protein
MWINFLIAAPMFTIEHLPRSRSPSPRYKAAADITGHSMERAVFGYARRTDYMDY